MNLPGTQKSPSDESAFKLSISYKAWVLILTIATGAGGGASVLANFAFPPEQTHEKLQRHVISEMGKMERRSEIRDESLLGAVSAIEIRLKERLDRIQTCLDDLKEDVTGIRENAAGDRARITILERRVGS